MDSKLIIANFKMNFTANQLDDWLNTFIAELKLSGQQESGVVLCPASIHIYKTLEFFRARGSGIQLGCQQALSLNQGPLTGELAISMLKGCANYLLIGHSEQRQFSNPSPTELADEIMEAIKLNITPVLCVGEALNQFEDGTSQQFISRQIREATSTLEPSQLKKLVVAYEPVWAIGSGRIPTNQQIEQKLSLIKAELESMIGESSYVFANILYGGSVNISNLAQLNQIQNLRGYLVGGASLKPLEFADMANYLAY